MTRRRLNHQIQLPTFQLGIAPRQTVQRHKIKRFVKSTQPTRTSILSCIKWIPWSVLFELGGSQTSVKQREEKLQTLRQGYNIYDTLQYKYCGIQIEFFKEEIALKEKWIQIEARCRTAFRRLVAHWIYRKYSKRHLNTEDPATLSEPDKPIYVFDGKARGTYVFEASTLKKHVESSLSYAEWLFPYPNTPTNPLTNIAFSKSQNIKILQELRSYGIGMWMFEAYRRLQFDLVAFRDIFMVPMKLRALEDMIRDPTHEHMIDLLSEFVQDEFETNEILFPNHLIVIKWAIQHKHEHSYIKEWLQLYHTYTVNTIVYGINEPKIQALEIQIHNEASDLFDKHDEIAELGRLRLASLPRRRFMTIAPTTGIVTYVSVIQPVSPFIE